MVPLVKSIPFEILHWMADHAGQEIRSILTFDNNVPIEGFAVFAKEDNPLVTFRAADGSKADKTYRGGTLSVDGCRQRSSSLGWSRVGPDKNHQIHCWLLPWPSEGE